MPKHNNDVVLMADLLKSGATLTSLSCPACSSPIFRLKSDELWCAKCQKKVVIVKETESEEFAAQLQATNQLESILLGKLLELSRNLQSSRNIEEMQSLSNLISSLLENLDKIKKLKEK